MKTLEYQKISYKESILLFTHKDLHIDLGDKKIIVSDYDKKKHRACYFPALEKLSLDELAHKYSVTNLSMRSLTKLYIELTNEKETLKAFTEECIDFINGGCEENENV